jgi:hypothetical protein
MGLSIAFVEDLNGTAHKKLYGLILGCAPEESARIKHDLATSSSAIFSPFTLMKVFLESEKDRALDEVDKAVISLQDVLENFDSGSDFQQPDGTTGRQELKGLIGQYIAICDLRNGLLAWQSQLQRILSDSEVFAEMPDAKKDIDPKVYLQRLIDDYQVRINTCGTVIEGTSLGFQMVCPGPQN